MERARRRTTSECFVQRLTKGAFSAPPPFDPVSIPHEIERRGVTTRTDPETESAGERPFSASAAGHRTEPGSTSQGGHTGSNPVGTTQVRGHVRVSRG